jgi:hypothetical protein
MGRKEGMKTSDDLFQWWSWSLMKLGFSLQEGTNFLNFPKTHGVLWSIESVGP